jgi:hypothetical protein
MEAVDTSGGTSGRQMMRIVRDEPQPWVFTFAPASAPWGASEPAAASPSSAGDGRPATVEQLMARIKLVLEKRGADSIAGLGRSVREATMLLGVLAGCCLLVGPVVCAPPNSVHSFWAPPPSPIDTPSCALCSWLRHYGR